TILELRICSLLTAVSVEAASRRSSAKAGRSADRGPAGNAGTALSKYPPPCAECPIRGGRAVHPGGEFHLGGQAPLSRRHRPWPRNTGTRRGPAGGGPGPGSATGR